MSDQANAAARLGRIAVAVVLWIGLLALGYLAWQLTIGPARKQQSEFAAATQRYEELLAKVNGRSPVRLPAEPSAEDLARASDAIELQINEGLEPVGQGEVLRVGLDGYSGYAVLRSPLTARFARAMGLEIETIDDGGDVSARLAKVRSGELHACVATLDALVRIAAREGWPEGGESELLIVLPLAESTGADAIVAYKDGLASLEQLAMPGARMVLTPDSPSETLARVVMTSFEVDDGALSRTWQRVSGSGDVLKEMIASGKDASRRASPTAYVLWEPDVSRALEVKGTHVLIDSGDLDGFIIDVLVTSRGTMTSDGPRVRALVESYQRGLFGERARGMATLIAEDAQRGGTRLTTAQAERIAGAIWWKNSAEVMGGVLRIADSVEAISGVMGLSERPRGFVVEPLVWRTLESRNFHPGGVRGRAGGAERAREAVRLPALDDAAWGTLEEVGSLRVPRVVFARGSASLTGVGGEAVRRAASLLRAFPRVYLTVRGHAASAGDEQANRVLAQQRAEAVRAELLRLGIDSARVRAIASQSLGDAGPAVTFVVASPAAE